MAYANVETVEGSNFLLSFERSAGSDGQRDAYKTKTFSFLGEMRTAYLNYNSQIWADGEIEFDAFSLEPIFYNNDV
jgi:hypothetical protein